MRRLMICAAGVSAVCLAGAPGYAMGTPREQPVVDERYGERLTDPYRWMEKVGPEFVEWAKLEDARTRSELRLLPGYAKLLADTTRAVEAQVQVSGVSVNADQLYFRRRGVGEAQASLYVRPLAGGPERKLIDPVALKGPTTALAYYAPSPDNRFLAYGLADGGSEEATLFILDLKTGRALPEAIDRARFGSPTWTPDGRALLYNRLKAGGVGADRFADETVYRHRPSDDPARDTPVFRAADLGSAVGRSGFVGAITSPLSPYVIAVVNSGVSPESEYFFASVESVENGAPKWTRFAALEDKVESLDFAPGGRAVYATTFRDTPRRKLVRLDLENLSKVPQPVLAQGSGVLHQIASAKDGLYAVYSEGGVYSLVKVEEGGRVERVALPFEGSIYGVATDVRTPGAAFSLESWVKPQDVFLAANGGSRSLGLAPPFPLDLSVFTSERIEAQAKDGTQIPVDVVYRKGIRRDGANPTLVDAYGAYGESVDADFRPEILSFLMQGGVFAEAHVRGGGEFGESWHLAGKGANKPNTWRDFIASIEALEKIGFTSPGKVAGMGVSAGGIMIGRTVTERPDLLAAAVMWVPMINTLRFETTEGGPANTAEFGSLATEKGYRELKEMDAYSHVVEGTKYPAVLLTGGINDHRVPVWMAAEMAARLRAASSSGKPVRLRVDFEGGHHMMGAAKADQISQSADTWAFVLQNTGLPAFQPSAATTLSAAKP